MRLSKLRIEECRNAARDVLERFHVSEPDDINLEAFAWHLGRLKIRVGGLTGSEGRLVATGRQGLSLIHI